jgi:hypothetical protein
MLWLVEGLESVSRIASRRICSSLRAGALALASTSISALRRACSMCESSFLSDSKHRKSDLTATELLN